MKKIERIAAWAHLIFYLWVLIAWVLRLFGVISDISEGWAWLLFGLTLIFGMANLNIAAYGLAPPDKRGAQFYPGKALSI